MRGSKGGHSLFVSWVERPDIFCWVPFLNPTYLPAVFVLSTKPNKMAEDETIPNERIPNTTSTLLFLTLHSLGCGSGFQLR